MSDRMVKEVQQWLNDTYPAYFKYDATGKGNGSYPIEPDGYTGTRTVKALVMAIQIHYNLTPVDGIWGNATSSACATLKKGVTDETIIRIAQGGFYCKGYNPGGFDGIFGTGMENAIPKYKEDLGITGNSAMEPEVFKSLLTTDPSVLVTGGRSAVREVQKYLNKNYYILYKSKLGYIPTGGIYERKTSKALIYAIQKEIGTTADGLLGSNTFKMFPSISVGCTNTNIVKILQAALICNSDYSAFDGIYSEALSTAIERFQKFMRLDIDSQVELGKVNRRTWGALLWSKGDTDRKPNACDCSKKILSESTASALYNEGFRYIGRYLTNVQNGNDKKLTSEEISILLNAGLKIFPIFQESPKINILPSDFNYARGQNDAKRAFAAASELGLKDKTCIYFSLDCDMTDDEITKYAFPYFEGICDANANINDRYCIGIYGARNYCSRICNAFPVDNSFVSDMSTGYSGNLGYAMPNTWAFDQFEEYKNKHVADEVFDLDYDMASGRDAGVSEVVLFYNPDEYQVPYPEQLPYESRETHILDIIPSIRRLEDIYREFLSDPDDLDPTECSKAVLDYLFRGQFDEYRWDVISPINTSFINYVTEHYADDEKIQDLNDYITGREENNITYRVKLLSDKGLGEFELPHLAVVIKCYIQSFVPGSWSAWAGDFASAVKEVYADVGDNVQEYLHFAESKIGAMEPAEADFKHLVQFNYCDIIADLDGYAICEMMHGNGSMNALSECISAYYSDNSKYAKRFQYFKPLIGFENWNLYDIKEKILTHFTDVIQMLLAPEANKYPYAAPAAAIALAKNILFWAKQTSVI